MSFAPMGAPAGSGSAGDAGQVSIPVLLLAGVLIGVGLLGVAYWQITQSWLFFVSIVPVILGGGLLFSKWSGPDHA